MTRLKLEGNAKVVADSGLVSISRHFNNGNTYIELGEYTLTKTGASDFFISSCRISGTGTLSVQEGTLIITHEYYGNSPGHCSDGTIQIAEGATFRMADYYGRAAMFSVKNLVLDGRLIRDDSQPHELTVTGSITGSGTAQMLKLADGAVVKLSGKGCLTVSEELVGKLVFDLRDVDLTSCGGSLPLIKVGSQELLPAENEIAFVGGKPRGWDIVVAKIGLGYQLKQSGMRVKIR